MFLTLSHLLPNSPPCSGLGLDRFRSLHIEQWKKERSKVTLDETSIFARLGHHGLISFSDYLFLLTIISSELGVNLFLGRTGSQLKLRPAR
jgi:hypothetical protein